MLPSMVSRSRITMPRRLPDIVASLRSVLGQRRPAGRSRLDRTYAAALLTRRDKIAHRMGISRKEVERRLSGPRNLPVNGSEQKTGDKNGDKNCRKRWKTGQNLGNSCKR